MKPVWPILTALAGLAACTEPTGAIRTFEDNCLIVLNDDELSGELAEASITPDGACACLQTRLAGNDRDMELVGLFLSSVAGVMEETGAGAEDSASVLVGQSMLPDETADGPTFADTLPAFNAAFEPLMDQMEDNGGACPASPPSAQE